MTRRFDVIVAGAGIVGVSTALHLQRRGLKVALIDRRGAGLETSSGNAGVIGNSYVLPFGFPEPKKILNVILDRDISARIRYTSLPRFLPWILDFYIQSLPQQRCENGRLLLPLLRCAADEHRLLMQHTDAERHMLSTGRATLYRDEACFAEGAIERDLALELGVPFEILDRDAFREIEPDLKPNFYKVVRWTDSPRLDNPAAVTQAYADRFVRDGGSFLIEDIQSMKSVDQLWKVTTAQGTVEADRSVVCLGPWSLDVLGPLGYRFPMAPKRGYHQHFKSENNASFKHAITDAAWGYVMAPMEQGFRLTSGAEIVCLEEPPNPVQLARALPRAQELFPFSDPVATPPWYGSRPCFADSRPVIGPAPRHPGLWFNFGHGHMGLTLGPSSAHLLADMMTGAKLFCDPTPYRATRFRI